MQSGFTGISYPFRINERGGVAMSTTSATDPSHIVEGIEQILRTNFLERPMEADQYSNVSTSLFEQDDKSLQQVLKTRIADDIERLEDIVECSADNIDFTIEVDDDKVEYLYATVTFKILRYNTTYTKKIKVGEVSHE